jgi:hypothetical protein
MENLILPHVAKRALDLLLPPAEASSKVEAIKQCFPNFPVLSAPEADVWLSSDFKKHATLGKLFDSHTLIGIADACFGDNAVFDEFSELIRKDFNIPQFFLAVSDVVRDVWTIGACHQRLS